MVGIKVTTMIKFIVVTFFLLSYLFIIFDSLYKKDATPLNNTTVEFF